MKYKIAIAFLILSLVAMVLLTFSGCKTSAGDVVTTTPDGWNIHSIVPVDTIKPIEQ